MVEVTVTLPEAIRRAAAAYERGQLGEAERLARTILDVRADYFDALHLIAVVEAGQRRHTEALASFDRALAVQPDYAEALYNRGVTLQELKRFDEALGSYDRALALRPDYAEAHYNRGNTLKELRRLDEALASYDRALAVRPDYAEALHNRGNVLKELQATNPRGGKQVEATLKARFSTRLGVSNIAMTSNSFAPSAPLVEQNKVAKRVQDELVQRVQDTQSSFTRILELSKQLNEVLSRPLPWI